MTTTEAALAGWAVLVLLIAGIAVLVARRAHDDEHHGEEPAQDG